MPEIVFIVYILLAVFLALLIFLTVFLFVTVYRFWSTFKDVFLIFKTVGAISKFIKGRFKPD